MADRNPNTNEWDDLLGFNEHDYDWTLSTEQAASLFLNENPAGVDATAMVPCPPLVPMPDSRELASRGELLDEIQRLEHKIEQLNKDIARLSTCLKELQPWTEKITSAVEQLVTERNEVDRNADGPVGRRYSQAERDGFGAGENHG
ncbi:hypothetical protein AJ80_09686 [Polytolypa hystricis UAMH7299]|uniref:Uncharacterized protein n=1 Tax=Polytolypa hystricis (strain UAMH7299) TaxID=1447883 RepID=A0A2B7WLY9_POLH7|nr:hypothetical protein AJ80_09686 [Polytolypa hystricis UAMH7299]